MDLLSQTLATTRLRSAVLAVFDLAAPWGIDCEQGAGSPCHYVLEGACWLLGKGVAHRLLNAGDLVMFPRWGWHALVSAPGVATAPIRALLSASGVVLPGPDALPDVPVRLTVNGNGSRCRMLSMVFRAADIQHDPVLAGLPDRVLIPSANPTMSGLLDPAMRFISQEAEHVRGGYSVIAHRLAELLFMQIVRAQLLIAPEATSGLLRGLGDAGIARALAAMHGQPGRKWTVASLAAAGGLSRSVFAARFRALTGSTPFDHLTSVRMLHARARLREGAAVKRVAGELGYHTSFAFAQAFKRRFGCPPSRHETLPM